MSIRMLRAASAAGAAISLVGVGMIIYAVAVWQPLDTSPRWWAVSTGVVLIIGIVSTVIASVALARRAESRQRG